MDTQLNTQDSIPEQMGYIHISESYSFTSLLWNLEYNGLSKYGTNFYCPQKLGKSEKRPLKRLPKAFRLNRRMKSLTFHRLKVDETLVARALRAGVRNDIITYIGFCNSEQVNNQKLMKIVCEGFRKRSTAFELMFYNCSPDVVKIIIAASYLKMFSLKIRYMDYSEIKRPLTKLFLRGNLHCIFLHEVKGLNENAFLKLGRCLPPNLTKLSFYQTHVPTSALKRLIGSIKSIFDSGREHILKELDLGATKVHEKLAFAYFNLVSSDLVGIFVLNLKGDLSASVVKSISSTVANAKNLKLLGTGYNFSSGTKFKNFILQQEDKGYFSSPFEVNP